MDSIGKNLLHNYILTETSVLDNNIYKLDKEELDYVSEIIYTLPTKDIIDFSRTLCNFLVEDYEKHISEISLPENARITFLNDDDRTTLCFFHRDLDDYLHNATN